MTHFLSNVQFIQFLYIFDSTLYSIFNLSMVIPGFCFTLYTSWDDAMRSERNDP